MQPVIKWSGSKRHQAAEIISYFPKSYGTYFEPFLGGGSILGALQPENPVVGDICAPLIGIWNYIKNNPDKLYYHYKHNWLLLQKDKDHYYTVRTRFNSTKNPLDFFFLTRTAYNGLVRFNSRGEFNSSFHSTRPGIHPDKLYKIINQWHNVIKDTTFITGDCYRTLSSVSAGDLVYLDPPYANTTGMYGEKFTMKDLIELLKYINSKDAYYVLSYDGKTTVADNTVEIPSDLYTKKLYTRSYNSSFQRLRGKKNVQVQESLYVNF